MTSVRVQRSAIEIEFNIPIDPSATSDLQNWNVQWWNYRWSHQYGSDLYSVLDPSKVVGRKGELKGDPIALNSITISEDRRTIRLETSTLQPAMQLMIKAALKTEGGNAFPIEYYGTINAVPR